MEKLLSLSGKLFKKDVISFLIVRRYDLGVFEDKLCYVSVKPTSSLSSLRQKLWFLLDLPDFCEEVIVLKRGDVEIPLFELRKGNHPTQPFTLEVWLPEKQMQTIPNQNNNMITMGDDDQGNISNQSSRYSVFEEKQRGHQPKAKPIISNNTISLNKYRTKEPNRMRPNILHSEYKKSTLTCKLSTTSILSKIQRRKSRDDLANILLKIQSDLSTLNSKINILESRVPEK